MKRLLLVVLAGSLAGWCHGLDLFGGAKGLIKEAIQGEPQPEQQKPAPGKQAEAKPTEAQQVSPPATAKVAQRRKTQAGFAVSVPGDWRITREDATRVQAEMKGKPGVCMSVVVNDYGPGFPVDASLKAYINRAEGEAKAGKIEKSETRNLGKAKGVIRVEKAPADLANVRRITFQGYAGSKGVNVVASALGSDFEKHRDQLMALLLSIEF